MKRIILIASLLSGCAGNAEQFYTAQLPGPKNALGFPVHGYGVCSPNPCPGIEDAGVADGAGGDGQ